MSRAGTPESGLVRFQVPAAERARIRVRAIGYEVLAHEDTVAAGREDTLVFHMRTNIIVECDPRVVPTSTPRQPKGGWSLVAVPRYYLDGSSTT